MFVCAPRYLRAAIVDHSGSDVNQERAEGFFDVEILERHPFTTQTFIPLGLSAEDPTSRYLVIVAPTLPTPALFGEAQRSVVTPSLTPRQSRLPSSAFPLSEKRQVEPQPGIPDLQKIRAFLAHGSQAVTYGAGTWHAPMSVVGKKKVTFVVTQFANGVDTEDCEEIKLKSNGITYHEGVVIDV
ncbi:MAG: Ureidoglycolate lyase, partial [Pleopsidium flavum]